mmetsp:Transcript_20197/g.49543  ORF Transcript_20197/g.49543 Transcript_20197/m.49543 type:complete len:247 (+) Transcript_20197:163-903(+)|eukprot:CAMPEP_0113640662 /NCGR_PEP_ID=MMETSP0017_2-20120614/21344_1 /TAXON_ID=2856 /ORGANISM="Cylindrotheca closterium" /LENGTH=246 /DNA_ID=CAMNT_0000551961 /DNA_START=146 /DNA_END=886 /DNA_ORIENTATION=- /assembly_acc=CAM_ASM_000147
MKSFMTAAPKRTLSSFHGVKSNAEARNGFRGLSSCLSSSAPNSTAFTSTTQSETMKTKTQAFSQTRNYNSIMGRHSSSLNSNSTLMMAQRKLSSPFTQGLSVRRNSDEKKSAEEEETLPPPIPGDNGEDDEDLTFEDPNEAKHDPEDLDGDRENFTKPIVINMPDMNDDNLISTIEKWYKEPGDVIKRNDILCDIATPDFTFGMVTEDVFDAIMGEHHVKEGESAVDNAPICTIYHQPEPDADAEE